MQAPRGVAYQYVHALRACRLIRIKYHRGGIGILAFPTLALRNHRDVIARAPFFQLLNGRRAKSIACGQHHGIATRLQALCQLANGGGFARTIYANH